MGISSIGVVLSELSLPGIFALLISGAKFPCKVTPFLVEVSLLAMLSGIHFSKLNTLGIICNFTHFAVMLPEHPGKQHHQSGLCAALM